MHRCLISVATEGNLGFYRLGLYRLRDEMKKFDPSTTLRLFEEFCPNWPSHVDKPYAFKSFALREAADTFDLLLWVDSSIVPIASMEPLWKRIEDDGYFLVNGAPSNYLWTADSAYPELFQGMNIDEAREINRKIPQIVGGVIGINVRSKIGNEFLNEYFRLAKDTNAFCGPWANTNCPKAPNYGPESRYTTSNCGPSDVLGHRHDQTAASVLAWRFGMKLAEYPAPYAYTIRGEGTILLHDGPGLEQYSDSIPLPPAKPRGRACPECGSYAVGMAGGMRICNQCGVSFV